MRKMSFAIAVLGIINIMLSYNASAAPAPVANANSSAPAESTEQASAEDQAAVKSIIDEISAAAKSGDQQMVAKLLASAIKKNPKVADKIVAAFVSSQSAASGSKTKALDVNAVINSVVSSLQGQKGSEALVAAVLSSYTPAAGGNNPSAQVNTPNSVNNNPPANLPPSLPNAGRVGNNGENNNNLPKENKDQVSPH